MRTCLVVLGMHRSGTSALAGLLSLLGADAGTDLMPTTEFNPKGYWELQPVFDLNEVLLAKLDRRWHDVVPLPPNWTSLPAISELMPRAQEIIASEFSESKLCVLKDPRFCLLLPFWTGCLAAKEFKSKHVVLVRSPVETAASLTVRDQFSTDKCAWLWLRYMLDAEQSTRGKTRHFLSFDDLLADWRVTATKLSKRFNLQFAITPDVAEAVEAFLDPQLRHFPDRNSEHSEVVNNGGALPAFCAAVYALMRKASGRDLSKKSLVALDQIRERFETWSADHIVAKILHEQAWTRSVVFGLNDRVAAMQTAAVAADAQIASQRAQVEELERARVQDATSLHDTQQRNDVLAADLSALTQQRVADEERASARNAELEAKLGESAEHRVKLEVQLNVAKERENALDTSLRDTQQRNDALTSDVSVLHQQLAAEMKRASARGAELEAKLRESSECQAQLEVQLSVAKEHENVLEGRLVALGGERDKLESRLVAMNDHSKRIEGTLQDSLAFHRKTLSMASPQAIAPAIIPRDEAALEGIFFACDRPENRETSTGAIDISGWCFGTVFQVIGVEVYWNEVLHSAKYGDLRRDVAQVHPQCPGALTSGFRCTVDAQPGNYFIGIAALCANGQHVRLGEGLISVRPNPLVRSLDTPQLSTLRAETRRFSGWCFSRDQAISSIALRIGNSRFPCVYGLQREDVAMAFPDAVNAGPSGFECDVPLAPGRIDIHIEATLASGESVVEKLAGQVRVRRVFGFERAWQTQRARIRRVAHTGRLAVIWMRRQRRIPRWHEVPLLLRKARMQLRTQDSVDADRPPAGWSPPIVAEPYDIWLEYNRATPHRMEALRERLRSAGTPLPKISILMPVFNPEIDLLTRAIASVREQVYASWELCIADDCSTDSNVRSCLEVLARDDSRIQLVFREVNGNISAATNSAASLAHGEFLLFLDQDDELAADALGEMALHLSANPDTDLLYSDDDKIDEAGRRYAPQFKPAWSPELLLSYMYMSHALTVRRRLFEQVGGFRLGFEGSQDYDFALRASERARRVGHLPLVLYHWRATAGSTSIDGNSKPASFGAGKRAVQEALARRGSNCRTYRPEWAIRDGLGLFWHDFADEGPLVSIIVPTRNHHQVLRRCLDSLAATTYRNYEVVVIDNESNDPESIAYLKSLPHRVLRIANPNGRFSFAYVNNRAAEDVAGEFVLFLNNDTEVRDPRWLSCMVGYARLPGVGAVGARLLYPDGRIQHAGIIHGLYDGLAGPAFKLALSYDHGYLSYAMVARNYLAVTAACMLTPRKLFLDMGGFDESNFAVAYNDVDYCYRLHAKGYRSVYAPSAELIHHEGYSRGFGDNPHELAAFRDKYRDLIDPYYSPHLSLENERFSIKPRAVSLGARQRPIRALFCAFTLRWEGAPYSQLELTLALRDKGIVEPVVYAPDDGPLRAEYERHGIPVHVNSHPLRGVSTIGDYDRGIAKFAAWIDSLGVELVYANTMETFFAIAAAKHAGLPSIWNIRESEPWQTYFRHYGDEIAARALDCFSYPYRVLFVAHATRKRYAGLESRHHFSVIHNGLNMGRLFASARDSTQTNSAGLEARHDLAGIQDALDMDRLPVSAHDFPRAEARARLGLAEHETMFLLLGTVCARKGQMDLIEALASMDEHLVANIRCFIVGDRPSAYSRSFRERLLSLPTGRKNRVVVVPETDETSIYYLAADLFVCTSRIESYPRVILEAMAYGLPIVTTPVFGIREQVIPGVNGLFYEPGDIPALVGALERFLSDRQLRERLTRNVKPVLQTLTDFDQMVAQYSDVFAEATLLSEKVVQVRNRDEMHKPDLLPGEAF